MPDWKLEIEKVLSSLKLAPAREREIIEELSQHLEDRYEELIASGLGPADAERLAINELNDHELLLVQLRRTERKQPWGPPRSNSYRAITFFSDIWQDMRFSMRALRKNPAFTLIASFTLALGIGANTAIFSVVNSVLLRPLAYVEPERLIWLWDTDPRLPTIPTSLPEFLGWRDQNHSFEYLAAYQNGNMFLNAGEGTVDARVGLVTPELFPLFKVNPILGRTFTTEETQPGHARVVILSNAIWRNSFGSDPNVVGKNVDLSGASYTIVGVMEAGFQFPNRAELWCPLLIDSTKLDPGPHYLRVVGRLKRESTLKQAQAEMSTIAARLSQQYAAKNAGHGVKLQLLQDVIVGDIGPALYVLLAAVGFVLLIACANVANLSLARVGARQKEIAVRSALGAGRARILKQLLTESVMLSIASGALGLLFAFGAVRWLVSFGLDVLPRVREIVIDPRVAGFTLLISLATGLLFGVAPAIQISRPVLGDALRESGRSSPGAKRNRLSSVLVISEVALSFVLLIGAGLMIRSFTKLNQVDPGFNPGRVLTIGVTLLPAKYPKEEQVAQFYSQVLEQAATVPGITSAGAISELPLQGGTSDYFTIEGRPPVPKDQEPVTEYRVITPHYFESMGIAALAGRDFAYTDTKQTPNVAIINEAFARRHFPGEDPLGHRIKLQGQERDPLTIVGVTANVRDFGLDRDPPPTTYVPFLQNPVFKTFERSMTIVAHTNADPAAVASSLRSAVTSLDKNLPVYAIKPMTEYLNDSLSRERFNLILMSLFGGVALLLAGIGIYGVISYGVAQRTREIGIRMALGAQMSDVLSLVVRRGLMLAGGGVALGLLAALALTRLISSLLFNVSATDPLTFVAIALLLGFVAFLACWIPARRATKVDPLIALRYE
jgi:putative ABC transport system permease protein